MLSKMKWAVVASSIAVVAACSTVTTSVDYDRSADFSRYRTYSWREVHRVPNDIVDRRIKNAVDRALSSRGLRRVEGGGDLDVVYHGRVNRQTQVEYWNTGWGYGWRWGGGRGFTTATVREIPVGTLIVDLVDTREKELVWRGSASRVIDREASRERKEKELNEAVQKMFDGFPPQK